MVKFTSLAIAIGPFMAAMSGTSAAAVAPPAFIKPCTFPYDVCGYTLTNSVYGYQQSVLEAAAIAAHQTVPPYDKSILYDAIYHCVDTNGTIAWSNYCGSGKCVAGDQVPNANCRP